MPCGRKDTFVPSNSNRGSGSPAFECLCAFIEQLSADHRLLIITPVVINNVDGKIRSTGD